MVQKIAPFLWFDNNAEEAAKFYTSVFKNSRIQSISRSPESEHGPAGKLMGVSMVLDGQEVNLINGGPMFNNFSEAFSLSVRCETQAEIDYFWEKLTADGGQESHCGWLKDKYGFSWQIVPAALGEMVNEKDQAASDRVMTAVLQMKKLDLAKIKQAFEGKSA